MNTLAQEHETTKLTYIKLILVLNLKYCTTDSKSYSYIYWSLQHYLYIFNTQQWMPHKVPSSCACLLAFSVIRSYCPLTNRNTSKVLLLLVCFLTNNNISLSSNMHRISRQNGQNNKNIYWDNCPEQLSLHNQMKWP